MNTETKVLAQLTIGKIFLVAVIIAITWLLLKLLRGFLVKLETKNPRLRFLAHQTEPPVRILIWFGGLLLAAEILAPSQEAFLGALASAALAIGLGLQDLIKNLIGGLVIVTDRPYQIGDRVKLADAYGEVVQIGLRSTKILTANGTLVTVPNSEVLTSLTFNSSGGVAESMISSDLSMPLGSDPDQLIGIAREVAVACPYTHLERPIEVELDDRGPGGRFMTLSIKAHVYDHRFEGAMQTEMLRRAKREFLARGIIKSLDNAPNPENRGLQ
jgi:small-conductance mechanosensitive channel